MSKDLTTANHDVARSPSRIVRVGALLSVLTALAALGVRKWGSPATPAAERYAYDPPPAGELPQLWSLPAFSLVDHRGAELSRESLQGRPFIASFIFTQCTNVCPAITSRLVQIQRRLAGRDVRFVSFSVDPAHDTAPVLAEYARSWSPDETRWALVATDEKRLPELVAAFRVAAEKTSDPDNPIIHSSVFFLVDAQSSVRGVYASEDREAVDRLVADVERLAAVSAGAPVDPPPASYASLGCAGCHERSRLAPPLVDLRGAERALADGSRTVIDDAYLRRALIEPGHEIVEGYLPLMPSYREALTDAEVDGLVQELGERTSAAARVSPAAEVALVTDPVCHMRVRAEPSAPHTSHAGHEVYFCSEMCRDAFVAAPGRFALEERDASDARE